MARGGRLSGVTSTVLASSARRRWYLPLKTLIFAAVYHVALGAALSPDESFVVQSNCRLAMGVQLTGPFPVSRDRRACGASCVQRDDCSHFDVSNGLCRRLHIPLWTDKKKVFRQMENTEEPDSPRYCGSLFQWEPTQFDSNVAMVASHCTFKSDSYPTLPHTETSSIADCALLCSQSKDCLLFTWDVNSSTCARHLASSAVAPARVNAYFRSNSECGHFPDRLRNDHRRKLLEKYAPRVHLAIDEPYRPSSVSFALDSMTRIFENGHWHLRLLDRSIYTGQDVDQGVPVYGFFRSDASEQDVYLVYYLFYPFNGSKRVLRSLYGSHDSDWEHVTVHLRNGVPQSVAYAAHEFFTTYDWETVAKVQSTHPVVYSSHESHGSWPTAGVHIYKDIVVAKLKDYCSEGQSWDTWRWVEAFDWENRKTLPGNREYLGTELPNWLLEGTQDVSQGNGDPRSGPILRWGYTYRREMKCGISGQCSKVQGPLGPSHKDPCEGPLVNLGHEFKPQVVFFQKNNLQGSRACHLDLSRAGQYDLKARKSVCRNDEIRSASFSNIPKGTRLRVCDNRFCSTNDDVTDVDFLEFTQSLDVSSFELEVESGSFSVARTVRQKWLDGKISRIEVYTNVSVELKEGTGSLAISDMDPEPKRVCTASAFGEANTCSVNQFRISP